MTVAQWSTTAALNVLSSGIAGTGGVDIDEGCAPSGVNNAMRDMMAQWATFITSATFTGTTPATLNWADNGATVGPTFTLLRTSTTPAASDIIGRVLFQGKDSAANTEDYAEIDARIDDPTSSSEDAAIRLRSKTAGVMTSALTLTSALSQLGSSTAASGFVIERPIETGSLSINGGVNATATCATLLLAGGSHASIASDYQFLSNNITVYQYDFSALSHIFVGLFDLSNAASGQIKFPASQNASADANTLDDYEEGTFTPGMTFNGSATGVTFTTQTGRYTKIGNRVYFDLIIILTSNGSGVGTALITGLPFTSNTNSLSPCAVEPISGFSGLTAGVSAHVNSNATTISLRGPSTTGSAVLTDTNVTDTANFYVSGHYPV